MTMHVSNLAATPATLTWDCATPTLPDGKPTRGTYKPRGYCGLGHDLVDARNGSEDEAPRRGRKAREAEPTVHVRQPEPATSGPAVVLVGDDIARIWDAAPGPDAATLAIMNAPAEPPPPAEEPHDPWCGLRGCKLPCGQASTRETIMSVDPAVPPAPLTADWPEPIDYDSRTALDLPVHGEPLPDPAHATTGQIARACGGEVVSEGVIAPGSFVVVSESVDAAAEVKPEPKPDRHGRKGDRKAGPRKPPPLSVQPIRHR